jgi:hypothetical protein
MHDENNNIDSTCTYYLVCYRLNDQYNIPLCEATTNKVYKVFVPDPFISILQ